MENIFYARAVLSISPLDSQLERLKAAGCEKIFSDGTVDAGKWGGFDDALQCLSVGDTLVVVDISRLSRQRGHAREILESLQARQVHLEETNACGFTM